MMATSSNYPQIAELFRSVNEYYTILPSLSKHIQKRWEKEAKLISGSQRCSTMQHAVPDFILVLPFSWHLFERKKFPKHLCLLEDRLRPNLISFSSEAHFPNIDVGREPNKDGPFTLGTLRQSNMPCQNIHHFVLIFPAINPIQFGGLPVRHV